MRPLTLSILTLALLVVGWLLLRQAPDGKESPGVRDYLGDTPEEGFERAVQPRTFRFPEDHGPHPGFRNEWWYFTGNLENREGHRFGFQLVFFRNALAPGTAGEASPWRSHQSWMAHFALTDAEGNRFHNFERFSRGGEVGLAGVRAKPFEIWLDEWSIHKKDGLWHLTAREKGVSLSLEMTPRRQPILQGESGLSRKSSEPGNASYYYSITRFEARGELDLEGHSHEVEGLAWLDREWSTSALSERQEGWDWFALQLSDGSDLMYYRLRLDDGTVDPYSRGSWMEAGGKRTLQPQDVRLKPLAYWSSPKGGDYPVRWRLEIPAMEIELEVTPLLKNQELDLVVRYWEGAVDVTGTREGKAIRGRGYLEMTGYDK